MENEKLNNGSSPEAKPAPEQASPPKSDSKAQPQKEHNSAEMRRRKKMFIMPLFFLIFGGVMWLIFSPSDSDKEKGQQGIGFNSDLPTPKDEGLIGGKRDAYEQEALKQKERDRMRSLQDFSSMFDQTEQSEEEYERQLRMAPKPPEYYEDPSRFEGGSSRSRQTAVMQSSASAYQDINKQLGSWYEEPATQVDEQAQLAVEFRIQELERKLEEAEQSKNELDEQAAMLEKSYQMAAKYMPQSATTSGQPEPVSNEKGYAGSSGKVIAKPVKQVQHNVVSLLSAPMDDAEFIAAYSQPRNMGFMTAAGNEGVKDKNSIRACVYQTVTLTNGKELQIRLLEPMYAGDILIPANSLITGSCRISGERLNVVINSIQYADNIIPVELQVYDTDGQLGIFVPGSDEINAAKEVAATLANSAGTSIMISDNAGSQLAADMGKGLIQGASQYVSKKMSVVKVTLKANYRLLLLPKTQ